MDDAFDPTLVLTRTARLAKEKASALAEELTQARVTARNAYAAWGRASKALEAAAEKAGEADKVARIAAKAAGDQARRNTARRIATERRRAREAMP